MAITAPGRSPQKVKAEVKKHLKTSAAEHLMNNLEMAGRGYHHHPAPAAEGAHMTSGRAPASPPPSPPSFEHPMMPVQQFLAGNYVEPGDVVVMTRLGSFFAWLLKAVNNSNFAHAAMVFQTPWHMDGLEQTFLIETSMGGVEIVSLSQFLLPKEVYADTGLPADFVVGIRRLEKPWVGERHRQIAASRMLHFIENHEYNFRLLAALASPRTRSLYFRILNSLKRKAPALSEFLKGGGSYMPNKFICSGFVQYAYVNMIAAAAKKGIMSADQVQLALEDVLFMPNATPACKMEELLACTPKYLAETDKLSWKYLIHHGDVFHVTSTGEVNSFFKETLPRRIPEAMPA
jgi:hypothetical protein